MDLEVKGRRFLIVGGSRGLKEAQDAARCLSNCQGMVLGTGDPNLVVILSRQGATRPGWVLRVGERLGANFSRWRLSFV